MDIPPLDLAIWLIPLAVSCYTFSYAVWLWRRQEKEAAVGTAMLAAVTAGYPAFVLFFVHV